MARVRDLHERRAPSCVIPTCCRTRHALAHRGRRASDGLLPRHAGDSPSARTTRAPVITGAPSAATGTCASLASTERSPRWASSSATAGRLLAVGGLADDLDVGLRLEDHPLNP